MALNVALLAVVLLSFGWAVLRERRRHAGLCPQCGKRPPDAQLGDADRTELCGSCVQAHKRGSRAAIYVFSGLTVLLAIMVIGEMVEDIERGYQYGLKDLPESALGFILLFGPFVGLVALSRRHLKAAERARMDTKSTATRAAHSGGPTSGCS